MDDEQKQYRQPPTFQQIPNIIFPGLPEALLVRFGSSKPQAKPTSGGFRVPSPTTSDEEELVLLEEQLRKLEPNSLARLDTVYSQTSPASISLASDSDHLSRLGDSTSIFSPNNSLGESPFTFLGSNTAPANPFNFGYSPSSGRQHFTTPGEIGGETGNRKIKATNMVVEREPPKSAAPLPPNANQPAFGNFQQPEFGKASPIQNRLQSAVFNIPKPLQARPEHHRMEPARSSHFKQASEYAHKLIDPFRSRDPAQTKSGQESSNYADVVEVPRPVNATTWRSVPPAKSTYSSVHISGGFVSVNAPSNVKNPVDLTTPDDPYNLDRALLSDKFGVADPYKYVDSGQATENIKALLEGAFEDDEDKPRTRGRKKKIESMLAEKLETLHVGLQQQSENHGDAEEDEDDGTVEGLNVKLLPHQVDGVEWMKDKEIGKKKKNGILPKGGILADDVGLQLQSQTLIALTSCTDGVGQDHPVDSIITCQSSPQAV